LAHYLLALATAVHVGGVEEVDSRIEGTVNHSNRVVVVGIAARAEHHAAQAQWAHLETGAAKSAILHGYAPPSKSPRFSSARPSPNRVDGERSRGSPT